MVHQTNAKNTSDPKAQLTPNSRPGNPGPLIKPLQPPNNKGTEPSEPKTSTPANDPHPKTPKAPDAFRSVLDP